MKILFTAFEPFDNLPTNSSLEVFKRINDSDLIKLELPVSYKRSRKILEEAIKKYQPDFILSLGQAKGESKIRLEKLAYNETKAKIADNDGDFRDGGKVSEDGFPFYYTKLDLYDMLESLKALGIPAYESIDPGRYICNTIYYTDLELNNNNALFVHLPLFKGQIEGDIPALDINLMTTAIKLVIEMLKSIS